MTTMIVSIALRPYLPGVAWSLFLLAAAFQIGFTAWVTGYVWFGGRSLEMATPATYMPAVGGFFVSALTAGTFGHAELGILFWGAGFISWLVWESVVLHRLMTHTLPLNLRATLGIHLTPPAIACAAYLAVTDGAPDRLVQAIFGCALLQGIILLRIVPWLREQAFSPAAWAYTFGLAALPLAAIRFVERGQAGPIAALALPLFIFANVVICWIAARTLYLAAKGKLFAD
jgi:tellurite resistance protein